MAAIDLTMGDGPPEEAATFTPRDVRIETDRLVLRRPQACDAVYLAELANDVDVARMTTGVPYPYRLGDAERFLAAATSHALQGSAVFLVEHPTFGSMGVVGLYEGRGLWPELGFWLGRTFRGRGFATEAVRAVTDWAADILRRPAVVTGHFVDNAASARVLAKAGFLYTGEVKRRFSHGRGQEVATRMMVRLA